MKRAALILCLVSGLASQLAAQTRSAKAAGEAGAETVVKRYIEAIQKRNSKTVIDLTASYQAEVHSIKSQNPQVLWPKLVGEYYEERAKSLSEWSVRALLPPSSMWKVTELRASADSITTYVTVDYASPEESPLAAGKLLKEAILQFDLDPKSQLVNGIRELSQGDVYWQDISVKVIDVTWQGGIFGGVSVEIDTVGGRAPFSSTTQCGPYTLEKLGKIEFTEPSSALHAPPSEKPNPRIVLLPQRETRSILASASYPLDCSVTVRDARGQEGQGLV